MIRKTIFLLTITLMFPASVFAASNYTRIGELEEKTNSLELVIDGVKLEQESGNAKLESLRDSVDEMKIDFDKQVEEVNKNSMNTASTIQISFDGMASLLQLSGVVLTFFAILGSLILALFANKINKKHEEIGEIYAQVKSATEKSEEVLRKHEYIKEEVEKENKMLQERKGEFYKEMKAEETKDLIQGLKEVPENVTNLFSMLVSRQLDEKYYYDLKTIFLSLSSIDDHQYRRDYLLIIFQHFAGKIFLDEEMRKELKIYYGFLISSSFKSDIRKSTHDILEACKESGIENCKKELAIYFTVLDKDLRYGRDTEVAKVIYNSFTNKVGRKMLAKILKEEKLKNLLENYVKFLAEDYKNDPFIAEMVQEKVDESLSEIEDGKSIEEIEKNLKKISKQKELEVTQGNFEMAANLRGQELKLMEAINWLKANEKN